MMMGDSIASNTRGTTITATSFAVESPLEGVTVGTELAEAVDDCIEAGEIDGGSMAAVGSVKVFVKGPE